MRCILIVFEDERPPNTKGASGLKGRKSGEVVPYGQSAYVVPANGRTTDDVLKEFDSCGGQKNAAIAVVMETYSGCGRTSGGAAKIQALLNE